MRILLLVVLSLVVISAPAYAQEANVAACMDQHKCCSEQGIELLGLTPEQKTKIDEIERTTQKAIIPVKAEIELKRIDLEKEMTLDKPNRDAAMKMVQDIHALELQIKTVMLDQQLKINGLLTPEQREKTQKMMHQCMQMKMMEMHGPGHSEMMRQPCTGCHGKGEAKETLPHHETE